jgi:hypothetical protein
VAGLVDSGGKPTITMHRFRHTLGTELAGRGAKRHTIMSILGHESPQMTMVYARISDAEVLRDYRSVLEPGAVIAGAGAEAIRTGALSAGAVDWLRSNFLKTELELGHCLRLPSEGPCECDLYLSCSRFVTIGLPMRRDCGSAIASSCHLPTMHASGPGHARSSDTARSRGASSNCCQISARRSSEIRSA